MKTYIGTFLIAFASLAYEVTLTRLLSVVTWYHLAFFAISTAMLGMTAGAVTVFLKPSWFVKDNININIGKACLGFGISVIFTLLILCNTPIDFSISVISVSKFILIAFACMLPFYFSGVAISAILTKHTLPVGKLYASDLIGASLGCIFVLGGLELLDAIRLIMFTGIIAIIAAMILGLPLSRNSFYRSSTLLIIFLCALVTLNTLTSLGITIHFVKGKQENTQSYIIDRWNSFSRVTVDPLSIELPKYNGPSPMAPKYEILEQYRMTIDGSAETRLGKFSSLYDIEYLSFDVSNIGYYIRPSGSAYIIGCGGGRDVQSAILFGYNKITGVDINPIFIDLLQGQFREFTGIADREEITLIADEGRGNLSRTTDKFTLIQMSLVDTWASTAAGAFTLSENTLYTLESWENIYNHLDDNGVFTVSRWYEKDNPVETLRIVSLATATLLESGITNPSQYIAVITAGDISTLLLSHDPFSPQDIMILKNLCTELQFQPLIIPGETAQNTLFDKVILANSMEQLESNISNEPFNLQPPTDENPYFFNMIKLSKINSVNYNQTAVLAGNISATLTLIGLIIALVILSIITVFVPLLIEIHKNRKTRGSSILWSGAAYFALIGAGFMFTEIALIQRLSVFLGNPAYALGILLFTLIASAGIGSYLSERIPLNHLRWLYVYPILIAVLIVLIRFILPSLTSGMMALSNNVKVLISIMCIFPLGLLLGICFPTGMRIVKMIRTTETPWYFALNGIFGVLSSALAVLTSIYLSISTSLYIAAICYILLILCLRGLFRMLPKTT